MTVETINADSISLYTRAWTWLHDTDTRHNLIARARAHLSLTRAIAHNTPTAAAIRRNHPADQRTRPLPSAHDRLGDNSGSPGGARQRMAALAQPGPGRSPPAVAPQPLRPRVRDRLACRPGPVPALPGGHSPLQRAGLLGPVLVDPAADATRRRRARPPRRHTDPDPPSPAGPWTARPWTGTSAAGTGWKDPTAPTASPAPSRWAPSSAPPDDLLAATEHHDEADPPRHCHHRQRSAPGGTRSTHTPLVPPVRDRAIGPGPRSPCTAAARRNLRPRSRHFPPHHPPAWGRAASAGAGGRERRSRLQSRSVRRRRTRASVACRAAGPRRFAAGFRRWPGCPAEALYNLPLPRGKPAPALSPA